MAKTQPKPNPSRTNPIARQGVLPLLRDAPVQQPGGAMNSGGRTSPARSVPGTLVPQFPNCARLRSKEEIVNAMVGALPRIKLPGVPPTARCSSAAENTSTARNWRRTTRPLARHHNNREQEAWAKLSVLTTRARRRWNRSSTHGRARDGDRRVIAGRIGILVRAQTDDAEHDDARRHMHRMKRRGDEIEREE